MWLWSNTALGSSILLPNHSTHLIKAVICIDKLHNSSIASKKFVLKYVFFFFKDHLVLGGSTSQLLDQVDISPEQEPSVTDPTIGAADEIGSATTGTFLIHFWVYIKYV